MTVIADGIDLGAGDAERAGHLKRIVENVIGDTDPSKTDQERAWIIWSILYICWYESERATTRVQRPSGPGRGLMQLEALSVQDLISNYILARPDVIRNLAAAAGVSEQEMRQALESFKDSADARANRWPINAPENKVEEWLRNYDSFGVKLMRYEFKRHGPHRFPPASASDGGASPQEDRFKDQFAEQWALWWKRVFHGSTNDQGVVTETPEAERARKKRDLAELGRQLDRLSRTPAPAPQPVEPTPAPPTPAPAPTPPVNPTPSPPSGGGTCGLLFLVGSGFGLAAAILAN